MSTISVRRLSPTGDPTRGQGLQNFLTDLDAVAQIIGTRIKLLYGEWWEALNQGTPLFQSILGVASTSDGVALLLRQRIIGTPYVTDIEDMVVVYVGAARTYAFSCNVQTAFGTVQITNQPLPGSRATVTTS